MMPAMAVDLTGTPFVEGSTLTYSARLLNEAGDPVPDSSLTYFRLTLLNPYRETAVNGLDAADALNVGRGTVDGAGNIVVAFLSGDTLKETSLTVERRRMVLDWAYGSSVGRHVVDFALKD